MPRPAHLLFPLVLAAASFVAPGASSDEPSPPTVIAADAGEASLEANADKLRDAGKYEAARPLAEKLVRRASAPSTPEKACTVCGAPSSWPAPRPR
ncbi:MAG: hypothetical protein ABI193_12380 [Minicystis sp.]